MFTNLPTDTIYKNCLLKIMLIILRHAHDNSHSHHKHDNRITEEGIKQSRKRAKRLVKRYGPPKRIYFSPFRRTRETIHSMEPVLKFYELELIQHNCLSRYFSKKEKKAPSIDASTAQWDVPIHESWEDFNNRVDEFIVQMQTSNYINNEEVTWCIVHALVYKRISEKFGVEIPAHIPFLDYFKLTK